MNDVATKETQKLCEASLVLDTTESKLGEEVSAIELQAESVVIATDEDYSMAGEAASNVKRMQKKVEEYWKPMMDSTKKAYDEVLAHKKEMLEPLKKAEQILKGKISGYWLEQERKRKEQEEAMRKLAEAEADRKLQEAIDASNAGDTAAAEFAMAEAEVYDTVAATSAFAKQTPKAKGVSTTKAWKITAIDSKQVPVEFCGMELRPVDEKLVMQLIKSSKGSINIPGIKYEETVTISVKS